MAEVPKILVYDDMGVGFHTQEVSHAAALVDWDAKVYIDEGEAARGLGKLMRW